jgi:DNA topoisomerase-1
MVSNPNMKFQPIKALVTKLKGLAKKSGDGLLASDEDREGEAISWHLSEELNLNSKTKRIVFMK